MTVPPGTPDPQRRARFEAFEDRLVLSGQPLDMMVLDPFESLELAQQYEIAPAVENTAPTTQVAGLTNRHGLTGSNQTVVVIDSGIAYDHVALGGGWGNRVVGGWDFAENDSNPYDDGPAGFHGTHVAGIIGSSDATYQGVASGVDLVALRVFNDSGQGNFSWVEQALRWVHNNRGSFENPITTVNLSLGTNWNSTNVPNWAMLEDEFRQLEQDGIFISVAAGNSFQSYQTPGLSYPAASPYVVPVASHGASGQMSSFSQRASNVLVAPGESIMSTVPEHLYGSNAQSHRFLAASGTSMAAPYVAGASVLVREAMGMLGYQNINQDMIEGHLRATADIIHDAVTNADYYKVNLQRALDVLMSDDYGNTVGTAEDLGSVTSTESVTGYLHNAQDVDAFSFVAANSGRVSLVVDPSSGLSPALSIPGVTATQSGSTWTFDVQAGQRYSFILSSTTGAGSYAIDVELEAVPWETPPSDLGTITQQTLNNVDVAGEAWYQITAGRNGILTLEAMANSLGSNFRMEVYDNDLARLASKTGARLDLNVEAGATYMVKLVGTVDDLDLRLTNLVNLSGNRISVAGTAGDDTLRVEAGTNLRFVVGETTYSFQASRIRAVTIVASAGDDRLELVGDRQRDVFVATPGSVTWNRTSFVLNATSTESIQLVSGGGGDALTLTGTTGDDDLAATGSQVTLTGADGNTVEANGFSRWVASGGGGNDSASLSGSTGNDRFWARSHNATLYGNNFQQFLADFDHIDIDATQGGRDAAYVTDSSGNDTATLGQTDVTMSGDGYSIEGTGFRWKYLYSQRGGTDSVAFYDSSGADRFTSTATWAEMRSPESYTYAQGFANVTAYSSGNVQDSAVLRDTSSADLLEASFDRTKLTGGGRSSDVQGFTSVTAYASKGADRAVFSDSAGDDRLYVTNRYASLRSEGKVVAGYNFANVEAIASSGGVDTATILGTSAVDWVQTGANNTVTLSSRGYSLGSTGFTNVQVDGKGGRDVGVLSELTAADQLFGRDDLAVVTYGDRSTELKGFAYLQAMVSEDEPEADVSAVDFVFEQLSLDLTERKRLGE